MCSLHCPIYKTDIRGMIGTDQETGSYPVHGGNYLTQVSWQQNCRFHDQNPDFPEKKVVIPIKIISAWQLLCLTYSGLTVP